MSTIQRLDSVKLSIPSELITLQDPSLYDYDTIRQGELVSKKFTKENKRAGFNEIVIGYGGKTGGKTTIDLSAKVLGMNYREGINCNNIDFVLDEVQKEYAISFNKNEFMDNVECRRSDVCNNIPIKKGAGGYIKALNLIVPSQKIQKCSFTDESIIFHRNVKTYKERLIVYNKVRELSKAKNKDFVGIYGEDVLRTFGNTLRVEANVMGKGYVRTAQRLFGTNDVKLASILNSDRNVCYQIYKRMIEENSNRNEIKFYDNMLEQYDTLSNMIKMEGMVSIVKRLDGDWTAIKELIMRFAQRSSKYKPSAALKTFRRLADQHSREKEKEFALQLDNWYESFLGELEMGLRNVA